MGGGGLRILPKKSWHVWNRDNLEKVERDERKHAEELEKKKKSEEEVERELRLEFLRKKCRGPQEGKQKTKKALVETKDVSSKELITIQKKEQERRGTAAGKKIVDKSGHINFFLGIEKDLNNAEYEAEKKAAEDRKLTMYLGQSSAETQKVKPWYLTSEKEKNSRRSEPTEMTLKFLPAHLRGNRRVEKRRSVAIVDQDPLNDVSESLLKKRKLNGDITETVRERRNPKLERQRRIKLRRDEQLKKLHAIRTQSLSQKQQQALTLPSSDHADSPKFDDTRPNSSDSESPKTKSSRKRKKKKGKKRKLKHDSDSFDASNSDDSNSDDSNSDDSDNNSKTCKKRSKKSKKHKRRSKPEKSGKRSKKKQADANLDNTPSLEQLRQERRDRERAEKRKTAKLLKVPYWATQEQRTSKMSSEEERRKPKYYSGYRRHM